MKSLPLLLIIIRFRKVVILTWITGKIQDYCKREMAAIKADYLKRYPEDVNKMQL